MPRRDEGHAVQKMLGHIDLKLEESLAKPRSRSSLERHREDCLFGSANDLPFSKGMGLAVVDLATEALNSHRGAED